MSNDVRENQEQVKEVLDQTLHRFKNNLQTQLSLMNIESATHRKYFDDRKVVMDRIFALTHIYDLYYKSDKHEFSVEKPLVSLQSFMLLFIQYLKGSTTKIDYELSEVASVDVKLDDLLLLSYILIEFEDFRKSLEDSIFIQFSKKEKRLSLTLNYFNINDHEKFYDLFHDQYKLLDLMVMQLKGKFEYKKKFIRLSFPIL
ncbi:histidine kinase dimerization/phosphoacceptor domain -containing protein [Psychroflexus tropicus]|uniref:histidine kinase dimerization/phosphoacceptor domain -containing protein n=1 Tax=Psychroflexus tropicus TaxID=197345 RepID=UPI0003779C71|nr:histidine kinase dimerization/phosphoacceptor domain -containing protein [Psychroflexus tropicus]